MPRRTISCIYCGEEARKVGKGEHIIPKAIGGTKTLKTVCYACNNRFSEIDKVLCSRSPLSAVASQQIGSHFWQLWDIDSSDRGLLLEAYVDWLRRSPMQYPQIVFDSDEVKLHGDYLEMAQFGFDNFTCLLTKAAIDAFQRWSVGQNKRLHFERISHHADISSKYRYPPRIFIPSPIAEFAAKWHKGSRASLTLRYEDSADRRRALCVLEKLNADTRFSNRQLVRGSKEPTVRLTFDQRDVVRALVKIGINLLAYVCERTPITIDHFPIPMQLALGTMPMTRYWTTICGFVHANDIVRINASTDCHSFRLQHKVGVWEVQYSFFGGQIGAIARFPGPSMEEWRCADIEAPARSGQWSVKTTRLLVPHFTRIEWSDLEAMIPAAGISASPLRHMNDGQPGVIGWQPPVA